jgi:phage terminase small subunit
MRGRKPKLAVVGGPQEPNPPPGWLSADAKAVWRVAAADLAARGLLFRGSLELLAAYCVCIAAIRQRQPYVEGDVFNREVFADQMKAMTMAKQLAVELGLTVTSRTRAFQGKSTDELEWAALQVG